MRLAPLLLAPAALLPGAVGPAQVTTMTFHQRIVIRVPRLGPPPAPTVWVEKRGPACIAAATLAGALVPGPRTVDLVLAGGGRVRGHLSDECEPLDFYSGFYLRPAADGRICAGRDAIHTRSGMRCTIERFRALRPKPAKR